ncbi:hypothetical protein DPMN_010695 [Dreissena polymorpha]|uniref:Uncharacterized protein n=1 Tax=Dreissena polymorpha TaxID=45954 RepID=A0A9D4S1R5_DREPO|nr:hypothetical protein DPMN_010695 [Dreissena polymorpha]
MMALKHLPELKGLPRRTMMALKALIRVKKVYHDGSKTLTRVKDLPRRIIMALKH